ncbi:uncharacterized protein LOC142169725 [Nicotiana tabacum]|uniref:Uncharacterized protein LOC142169725 n=1 Tax=Nicotiana tabacum TaxID=4097 RepID=A0AC58SRY5_TOBAC
MTTDRLLKWNINVDPMCVFCKLHPETHAHLVCECTVTSRLWKDVFDRLQMQVQLKTWAHLVSWFMEKAKKKYVEGQLMRRIFAEVLYSIWNERNQRVFNRIHRDRQSIIREVAYLCNVRVVSKLKLVLQNKPL